MKLHITEKALREFVFPEGKHKEVLFDQEQTGFAVQVTPKGAMTYVVVYRDADGSQRQEKIARVGTISAQAARSLARARVASVENKARPRRSVCVTMDDFFFNTYLPIVKAKSRSHETHASIYRNHVQPVFGSRRLDDVTSEDILAFNELLRAKVVAGGRWRRQSSKRLSDGTVKRILILVRHLFNVAIRDKRTPIRDNPTHELPLTTERRVKGRFLSKEQLADLLKAAEASENQSLADIIRVMGATGLRRENVLGLEWAWLDEVRGTLTVPAEADKAKKGFMLFLSAGVLRLLQSRREQAHGRWVFPNPETGKPYSSCRYPWVTACKRANLPGLRMHDLRHTYASMMLESGSDIVDVQKALGHTQLKTTAVYLHLTEGRKRERANAAVEATGLFAA